ncbi:MAG TPA: PilT/PilU family type 4a pilus ATPase [Candidatus Saccharimonadales bacterium]|nr:PilT/PilU family type 4a pilus ATPase [Candidatus Saccharimonadales bacterium]
MNLETFVRLASAQGASDLHLEPGLPLALRIRGQLKTSGEPVPAKVILDSARNLIGDTQWPQFLERRSYDLSKTIEGVRCRINILQTSRGIGLAIRLLAAFQATLEKLNLHPDLKRLTTPHHGLILVCGPTGSGKSSTLAALIQEINLAEARHIVTIESPIEYTFRPRMAYIRQREVGRDTPSFEQALLDALREDPDVLMVGEMRDPETMRLTLNAAETGHLVLATVHSSTCAEALQRIVSAFPAEMQNAVRAQLSDCFVGAIAQRLRFRPELKIRVPECEILLPTMAIRNFIRVGDFFKISSSMETGAEHGMYTFQRYQTWLENKKNWHVPTGEEKADSEPTDALPLELPAMALKKAASSPEKQEAMPGRSGGRIEIEPVEGGLGELLRKIEKHE